MPADETIGAVAGDSLGGNGSYFPAFLSEFC